jgi:UDP-N-acetylmuramoyl-tripeptide--D-alanyl-D-alanine ligase
MELSSLYTLFSSFPRAATDSRSIPGDSIYFALRGERFDGNRFAADALSAGARYAVVDDPAVAKGERFILVENSLETLQNLASYHRQRLSIPIIGITGSNGKTTTKELLSDILSTAYSVKATEGNLNNHIGVPLTLLGMNTNTEIGIVEMGANHTGEITRLCRITQPDYGLLTNIGKAHLEGFGSLEGVKKAKGELYDYLDERGGLVFCNADDPVLQQMVSGLRTGIVYYGRAEEAVCSAEILSADPYLSLHLEMAGGTSMEVETSLTGTYNLDNILAAVCIGLHFRIPPAGLQRVLTGWAPLNNRSQRIETPDNILIMDAYNANPTSMIAALENFSLQSHPGKTVILGDMLELGTGELASHREILDYVLEMDCTDVFLVGPVFSGMQRPAGVKAFENVGELESWLTRNPLKNRLILLKASRGIGLERIREKL